MVSPLAKQNLQSGSAASFINLNLFQADEL
jgi:hypothetical protein